MDREAGNDPHRFAQAPSVYRPRRWQRLGGVRQITLEPDSILVQYADGAWDHVPLRPAPVIRVEHDHGTSLFFRFAGAAGAFFGIIIAPAALPIGLGIAAAGGAAIFKHIEGFSRVTFAHGSEHENRVEIRVGAPPDDPALTGFLRDVRLRTSHLNDPDREGGHDRDEPRKPARRFRPGSVPPPAGTVGGSVGDTRLALVDRNTSSRHVPRLRRDMAGR